MVSQIYKTSTITEAIREKIPPRVNFDVCEDCGYNWFYGYKTVRFYPRHKRALCDQCVDRHDGHPWECDKR